MDMNETLIIPTLDELSERIRACRVELAALRKLQRLARAAQEARDAHARHQAVTFKTLARNLDEYSEVKDT